MSDEEIRGDKRVSVGGKAPRVSPIQRDIPINGTANRVLPVSDEVFKIVFHASTNIMTFAGNHDQSQIQKEGALDSKGIDSQLEATTYPTL
jgi:hypothetical protein